MYPAVKRRNDERAYSPLVRVYGHRVAFPSWKKWSENSAKKTAEEGIRNNLAGVAKQFYIAWRIGRQFLRLPLSTRTISGKHVGNAIRRKRVVGFEETAWYPQPSSIPSEIFTRPRFFHLSSLSETLLSHPRDKASQFRLNSLSLSLFSFLSFFHSYFFSYRASSLSFYETRIFSTLCTSKSRSTRYQSFHFDKVHRHFLFTRSIISYWKTTRKSGTLVFLLSV